MGYFLLRVILYFILFFFHHIAGITAFWIHNEVMISFYNTSETLFCFILIVQSAELQFIMNPITSLPDTIAGVMNLAKRFNFAYLLMLCWCVYYSQFCYNY